MGGLYKTAARLAAPGRKNETLSRAVVQRKLLVRPAAAAPHAEAGNGSIKSGGLNTAWRFFSTFTVQIQLLNGSPTIKRKERHHFRGARRTLHSMENSAARGGRRGRDH